MKNRILTFVLAIALTVVGFNLSYANVSPKKLAVKSNAKIERTTTAKKSSNKMNHKKHHKAAKKSANKSAKKSEKKSETK